MKRATWAAAVTQVKPNRTPPHQVRVRAHFRLHQARDEDNLKASLKYVLDALRLPSPRDKLRWRQGLYLEHGYLVDDSPVHCRIEEPTQEVDRKNRGLTLIIETVSV